MIEVAQANSDTEPLLKDQHADDEPAQPELDFQDQNPIGPFVKWLFIFACCIYPLGSQSMYDSPAAMGSVFLAHYNMTNTDFGFLYSMYALPNLIIVFMVRQLICFGSNMLARLVLLSIELAPTGLVFCSTLSSWVALP